MARPKTPRFDEIGYWSEVKLDIIRDYAKAYSTILAAQEKPPLHHVYIDAFAGGGLHFSKTTGDPVEGSPRIALGTDPPFRHYHFIDLDGDKVARLAEVVGNRSDVSIYNDDCNTVLLSQVFPQVQYKQYRRGLCLLDPYGLHLDWKVIHTAGQMGTIDIFLNFPIMDMNRNVLWHNREGVKEEDEARMTAFWGDDSWREAAYKKVPTLFDEIEEEKATNTAVVAAFRRRLQDLAGFASVPEPMPMRNSTGVTVYYLFFASQKPVARQIVTDIFRKYRDRGGC